MVRLKVARLNVARLKVVEALRVAVARDLPPDVRAEEITVLVCFRGSLALNAVTGGPPAMTFSARCHAERLRARSAPRRAVWRALAASIDLGCALLRGEAHHCEVAWRRHRARDGAAGAAAADERAALPAC